MTANTTKLKRLARRRQRETGERYTDALAAVRLPKEVSVESSEKRYVGVPFLMGGTTVPVFLLQGGSAPSTVRTAPVSSPLTIEGIRLQAIAGFESAIPCVGGLRKVRPDKSVVELFLRDSLDEWEDGRKFYGNCILSEKGFVRKELLEPGDYLEIDFQRC